MPVSTAARRSISSVCLGLCLTAGLASSLNGQAVRFRSRGQGLPLADEALLRVLERNDYLVVTSDTILPVGQVVVGDLIIIAATMRVEGRVRGDVIGVQSDIFARPGSRIDGVVAVLGGGFYGSSLAHLSTPPIDAAAYAYQAQRREDGDIVVIAPGAEAKLRLPGVYGLLVPRYDRVNALTLEAGVEYERGASTWLPDASGRIRYRSARTDVDGDLELRWPFGRHLVLLRGGRTDRSNDRWLNTDLENSLYAVVAAVDSRNYYDARFGEAELRFEYGTQRRWWLDFLLAWERARSLADRDPFSLFSARGGFRENLPVTEADAASVALAGGFKNWLGGSGPFELQLSVEHADRDIAGDLSFTVLKGALSMEIPTVAGQKLVLEGRGQVPGDQGAPAQRWRALGGWGSLPTLKPVERSGDVMWWGAVTYRASLRKGASYLTRLVAWLQYAAGNAWVDGEERPAAVHNLAAGVTLGPLAAGVFSDPSADFETVFALGIDSQR